MFLTTQLYQTRRFHAILLPVFIEFSRCIAFIQVRSLSIKYIIADNVKLYRKKQNLTQFELAEKTELSVDSIKRIEHGSRTMSLENFMRIADALDVPLSYLMYENLNLIPITERILNILNSKSGKQQEYLLHMLEEMSFGLDNLL